MVMVARIVSRGCRPLRISSRSVLPLLTGALLSFGQFCAPNSSNVGPDGLFDPGRAGDSLTISPSSDDQDGEGIANSQDNCPAAANALQEDSDGDGIGDACDACPGNDDNLDSDSDGTPDCKDLCPNAPDQIVPGPCGCGTLDSDCPRDSGSNVTQIILNGNSIDVVGTGVTVNGTTATLTSARTYNISGTLADGQIIVNTPDAGPVRLVLNGVDISSSVGAPVHVAAATKADIVLVDQSTNRLSDPASYASNGSTQSEPDAAVFSQALLTISGNGSLTVTGHYQDGIASTKGLVITSGTITVNAVDEGIRGRDYLVVVNGLVTVNAGGDGLKADNADDSALGYIYIAGASIAVTSGGDAITAETKVLIASGDFTINAGGGSSVVIDESLSAKGIKGLVSVTIDDGAFVIDSADDAIHSNASVTINVGRYAIATGDDGVHADAAVTVNGGEIDITRCFEGIEGVVVTINDGTMHIVSSDDALNVAGDLAGTGYYMFLNGGHIVLNAAGDGIDVNGSIVMTGGTVIVNGPTANDNGALDFDASCVLTGGYLLAAGSAGMAQTPSATSTLHVVRITFATSKAPGSLVRLQTQGKDVFTFAPAKNYRSVIFSSSALLPGSSYDLYTGGSCTGTAVDGLCQGGTYTPGTKAGTFTVSSIVTNVNAP